ncbi:MAG: zinc metallopeptidase [Chloroflexi bacterium]|uniref:Zinc metallopeptidase n=1 Tax=Candidatus Thermofonsia Clade 3 bacterium TaxID=2364212 RepID=A0A2M8QG87_9CHLR|nr:zinc metallopeptidase [Candidatus Roseilinea sp. NK_OTU-006]PJF48831.1 MAG: zinc metallopeptidase [Candidatus Thermofonsia Clade 3 bacterium]RMG64433.1 MAG: zinc metallopeptidase [Chloroflexota bacterium]
MFYFDPLYFVFAVPPLLLAMWAQWKVQSTFAKYARVPTRSGVNGIQTAQVLINRNGLSVGVTSVPGHLTDHYDPRSKTVALSQSSQQNSIASVAVVAHELGHALQDKENYGPLKLRGAIVPAVQLGGWVGPILFILGLMLASEPLMWVGVIGFGLAALFAIVTLPVEFDASRRALAMLQTNYLLTDQELRGAKQVLDAAALTYVAAAAQALTTLLYYITLMGRQRD